MSKPKSADDGVIKTSRLLPSVESTQGPDVREARAILESVLLSTAEPGYSSEQVFTNYLMMDLDGREIPRATVQIRRTRVVEEALEETLQVDNYNNFPVHLEMQFRFAADFADIFVVRGFASERSGKATPP